MWPNRALASAVLCCSFLLAPALALAQAATCSGDEAVFPTSSGPIRISVEIADDPAKRQQGLMNREELPSGAGMLFMYETPRPASFWMRNTLIPLDMIFMDDRGVIRHIHPNAVPLDETPIPGALPDDPNPERLMILEIGGGEAARLGLHEGQAMAYPRLEQNVAAAPCR